MAGRLFAVSHSGGVSIPLNKREMLIGRAEGCDVCIHDPAVSSRHCLLKFAGATWIAIDLKSKNGTQVNGGPITERALRSGDTLAIAHRHRYRIEYTPSTEAERFTRSEDQDTISISRLEHPSDAPATQKLRREEKE